MMQQGSARTLCVVAISCIGLFLAPLRSAAQDVQLWMPGVLSRFPNVRDLAISPDGVEHYVTIESLRKEFSTIVLIKLEEGRWSTPQVAPFSGRYRDIEPAFSPGGLELFFASNRPVSPDSVEPGDYNIWYVTRTSIESRWSEPRTVGAPVNTSKAEYYPSLTMWGDLYFTREADDPARKEDIFVSRKVDGVYEEPTPLSDSVNSNHYEFNAFVAPDESFLVFTSYAREDEMGGGDLYISYRRNGSWMKARHLTAVNSSRLDYCPFVDTRNGILYFTSERSSQPTSFESPQTIDSLLDRFRTFPNGSGRIYWTRFPVMP